MARKKEVGIKVLEGEEDQGEIEREKGGGGGGLVGDAKSFGRAVGLGIKRAGEDD